MTRTFIVRGHEAGGSSDFALKDLPGLGRLDLLCRCVNAAFLLSHDLRRDTLLYLVFDEATLRFDGGELQGLNPDERSIAGVVRNALRSKDEVVGGREIEASPGVYVSEKSFREVLEEVSGTLLELNIEGLPVVEVAPPNEPVFVLSDHTDFTEEERRVIDSFRAESVRLSPETIHSDHAISVTHNWLDTQGYSEYN